jgi:uncharacterized membrane protein YedE/YeeE
MMEWLEMKRWSPYAVGVGIGMLSWAAFLLSDRPLGCSAAFSRASGMIERLFRGHKAIDKLYYQEFKPVVDWELMLLIGIVLGSFISSQLSGQFSLRWVPDKWALAVSGNPFPRIIAAFLGGTVMGLGARWAGGCTSGHGLSGMLQLAVSGWIATLCFFAAGMLTAMMIL